MPLRPKWPTCQAGALQYSIRFQVQIKQFELNTVYLVQQRCQEGHWQPLAWRLPAWLLLCKLSLCSSVNHTIWEDILQLMATHRRAWWPGSSFTRRMSCDSGLRQEISHTFTTFPKGTAASPSVQQLSGTLSSDLYVRNFCKFLVYQCSSVCVHMCVCAHACMHTWVCLHLSEHTGHIWIFSMFFPQACRNSSMFPMGFMKEPLISFKFCAVLG